MLHSHYILKKYCMISKEYKHYNYNNTLCTMCNVQCTIYNMQFWFLSYPNVYYRSADGDTYVSDDGDTYVSDAYADNNMSYGVLILLANNRYRDSISEISRYIYYNV